MTIKPLIKALQGKRLDVPPVWLMRQAGRYLPEYRKIRSGAKNFLDFCYTPELAVEATLQPIRRFAMDGAIIFSDILVIPDALGQEVSFVEGKGPVLVPLENSESVSKLSLEPVSQRLQPVYEALSVVKGELPPETALIGFAGAPWTIATYMIEGGSSKNFARAKSWIYSDPNGFSRLIDLLVNAIANHLIAQVSAGAEALQIFDSWAGVLPERAFRQWTIEPIKKIITRVKAIHPDVPIIGFPNRAGVMYAAFAAETGVDAVSIDSSVPLGWAAAELQSQVTVQGNLDPIALLSGGAALKDAVRTILDGMKNGAHVFNLGHGVLPPTPPDHVAQLVDYVRGAKG
ncbi:MAG: uroporphyrinogen decarboxylase [Alphaproteobacteria bacterium]